MKRFKACPFCNSLYIKNIITSQDWIIDSCLSCTNAWTVPSPDKVNYAEQNFHSQFFYQDINDLPKQWKSGLFINVALLNQYLKSGAKILEIGCGEGILLKELSRQGFNVFGIEPSKTASQSARDAGLNVITGYFPDKRLRDPFDAVIMSHVLEHVPEPDKFLSHFSNIMAQSGFVLFVQTNWKGLMPRIYKQRWYAWVPEHHFWHFAPKGISILCRNLNWTVLDIEYSSLEHGNNLISQIGSAIPGLGDQFHLLAEIL